MNRIYLPYPIEVLVKVLAWPVIILIDLIELLLAPFSRIGTRGFAIFTVAFAVLSSYAFFAYNLTIAQALAAFAILIAAFWALLSLLRFVKGILAKNIRPPFARIIFETVVVSFRRPCIVRKIKVS